MKRRVAVTGMAGISPIGNDWPSVRARLGEYRNAVRRMDEWSDYDGLHTLLGAPAAEFALSERYTTKSMRSMGRGRVDGDPRQRAGAHRRRPRRRSVGQERPAWHCLRFFRRHTESDLRLRHDDRARKAPGASMLPLTSK